MPVPALTDQQRAQARAVAITARRRRAEVKAALRNGTLTLADVLALAEHDEAVAHVKVVDALMSLPKVGPVTVAKLRQRLDIADDRRLRGLGKRQTARLLAQFPPTSASPTSASPP